MAKPYLRDLGLSLLANGWDILPAMPGTKRPPMKGWEQTESSPKAWKSWMNGQGFQNYGVCIRTKTTPAVDIDVHDEAVAGFMSNRVIWHCGEAPIRIGQWPKRLYCFRADVQFAKVQSRVWISPDGKENKVEVLGDGQQFVAFHIHPDTKQQYVWGPDSPSNVAVADLPELTEADARLLVHDFEDHVSKLGWTLKQAQRRTSTEIVTGTATAADDWTNDIDVQKTEHTAAEVRAIVMSIPNNGRGIDYDEWTNIGMAIFHQTDGSEEGFEIFNEWSKQSDKNEQKDTSNRIKWKSYNAKTRRGKPITFRVVLERAAPFKAKRTVEGVKALINRFELAGDEVEFNEIVDLARSTDRTEHQEAQLEHAYKTAFRRLFGVPVSINRARKALKKTHQHVTQDGKPSWMEGWCFLERPNEFFNTDRHLNCGLVAFDTQHQQYLLSKEQVEEGAVHSGFRPSEVALNRHDMRRVFDMMYVPRPGKLDEEFVDRFLDTDGMEAYFQFPTFENQTYVNTYSVSTVPSIPEKLSATDRKNCEIALRHFEHMIEDEFERRYFFNWLAYIVQTGKHPNYAVLLQGVQGDGKSWFHELMSAVLGSRNTTTTSADALNEKNTPWAYNTQFTTFEEIMLQADNKDRTNVLNKLKPYITNSEVSIRIMNTDWFKVVNTVSYLLLTNFRNAMPLGEGDRRYLVLFSRFQNVEELQMFKQQNPDYYAELMQAPKESAGALRKMFLEHTIDSDFDPDGSAPITNAFLEMAELNQFSGSSDLKDILEDAGNPLACYEFAVVAQVRAEIVERTGREPSAEKVSSMLSSAGLHLLGRMRLDGKAKHRVYSRYPKKFRIGRDLHMPAVRRYLRTHDLSFAKELETFADDENIGQEDI